MKLNIQSPIATISISALFAAGMVWGAYRYYQAQSRAVESGIGGQLAAVAELKVGQFAAWRRERIDEAQLIAGNPLLRRAGGSQREIETWLGSLEYPAISVVDRNGRVRVSSGGAAGKPEAGELALAEAALRSGQVRVADLYWTPQGEISMEVAAPIPGSAGSGPDGAVVTRIDPYRSLYPMIRGWPIPSRTGESLLVPEGDTVILKEPGPSTLRRLPDIAAAGGLAADRSGRGIRYFTDYRGAPVLAAVSAVPDTPLRIVAKMDVDEIYSSLRDRSRLAGLAWVALLAGFGLTLGLFWYGRKSRIYQRQNQVERERRAMAERYAQLRSCIDDSLLMTDCEGRITEANDRAVEIYGYSHEELLGRDVRQLASPAEVERIDEKWRELEARGFGLVETVHQRKDGSTFPVEASLRLSEVDGQKSWQCIVRDITERKRAEGEVSRANRALRVLSACNQALVRATSESQLLSEICEAVTGAGGYPLAWIGFAENDPRKTVRCVAASGQAKAYLDGLTVTWSEEAHGLGPTGTCIRTGAIAVCAEILTNADFGPWRERAGRCGFRSAIALPLRCGGTVIGALSIYAAEPDSFQAEERRLIEELAGDLAFGIEVRRRETERARAEAALRQSELEFRTVFEAANDAIVISDLEGHVLEVNEVACRRLGYSREELLRLNADQIDGSPADEYLAGGSLSHLLEGQVFEAVSRRKDGTGVPVEVNARGFEFKGAPAILGVARDITERKRAEAEAALRAAELDHAREDAVAANRAKSDFLTHVSHEMRTPLNAVIGMTGLLLDSGLAGERREHAETVRGCAEDLLNMINSILDLSGIEAGRVQLECSSFDLVECLKEIGDATANQAAAKGLAFRYGGEAGPRWVFGDAGRLRQVVLNLLSNAVKFTERGSVEMRLTGDELDLPGAVWRISVKDTGIGISQEKLPLLFGRFAQVDSSLVRRYEGAGLGLVISQELAMLMGGAITVITKPGLGSEFTLRVPLAPCAPRAVEPAAGGEQPALRPRTRRVLLAEDNAVNLKLGVRLLERMGCRVDAAGNGREAVQMADRLPYDLIFMDCRMPEMDGYEASRRIRSLPGDRPRVPIVALTAHAVKGAREECLQAGMDDYVTKPVRPADLERMLVRWSA